VSIISKFDEALATHPALRRKNHIDILMQGLHKIPFLQEMTENAQLKILRYVFEGMVHHNNNLLLFWKKLTDIVFSTCIQQKVLSRWKSSTPAVTYLKGGT
jgi:hypothetical protein